MRERDFGSGVALKLYHALPVENWQHIAARPGKHPRRDSVPTVEAEVSAGLPE